LLLTFDGDDESGETLVEWAPTQAYFTEEDALKEYDPTKALSLINPYERVGDDLIFDLDVSCEGIALTSENHVYPEHIQVLKEGEVGIDLSRLKPQPRQAIGNGDRIVLREGVSKYLALDKPEYVIELTVTDDVYYNSDEYMEWHCPVGLSDVDEDEILGVR